MRISKEKKGKTSKKVFFFFYGKKVEKRKEWWYTSFKNWQYQYIIRNTKGGATMGYVKWSYSVLEHFCHDVFRAFGFDETQSKEIEDVLLTADLFGIESHGMQRMVRYHKGIEKGTIHPLAKPEVVFETPVSAVIDGHNGMGQLISIYAM